MQARLGRIAQNYDYDRVKVIKWCVSINGRSWKGKVPCDYMACVGADHRKAVRVGEVVDFVVVSYTNKNIESLRGRVPSAKLQGQFMFVRLRQYDPTPVREANFWVAPERPLFRQTQKAIPVRDICSYLHAAKDRGGREDYVNLITVAVSFVNA